MYQIFLQSKAHKRQNIKVKERNMLGGGRTEGERELGKKKEHFFPKREMGFWFYSAVK